MYYGLSSLWKWENKSSILLANQKLFQMDDKVWKFASLYSKNNVKNFGKKIIRNKYWLD